MDAARLTAAVSLERVHKTFPVAFGYAAFLRQRGRLPLRTALEDVTFRVAPGELFGLLGANGAGKSTILRLLSGLVVPDRGRITIDGIDSIANPRRLRGRLGLCTGEERSFYFRLSARANLEYFAALAGVPRRRQRERIEEVAEAVDLARDLDRRFDAFSAGMCARLAVARALLADPPIVLFDEPTRAVDPVHAHELRRLITGLTRAGKTVVLATNLLDEAWELCDRVAVLKDGRVATVATPAELRAAAQQGRRYVIHLDRHDAQLLARVHAVAGVLAVATTGTDGAIRLDIDIDDQPRTLTAVLQAVSSNGVAIGEVRPQDPELFDVFAALTGTASVGR
jgi:ABC-2 type transport system ATP-binding protein